MTHAKKLGWTLCTALGIAAASPAMAEEYGMEHAFDTNAIESTIVSSQAAVDSAHAAENSALTLIVSEPSLVFTNGQWYTYVDGNWLSLEGGDWQDLTATSHMSSADIADDDSMPTTALADEEAYAQDDGVWFVWVPTTYEEPQIVGYEAEQVTPTAYDIQLVSVNGIPIYSVEEGQWYVLVPMAADELVASAALY